MTELRYSLLGDCTVYVDGQAITPTSTHLFALLLLLGVEGARPVTRADLQRCLFPPEAQKRSTSHNLRQLLYRLRRLGLAIEESATGIRLTNAEIVPYIAALKLLCSGDCTGMSRHAATFLPGYEPPLPRAFTEWLEDTRSRAEASVRDALATAVEEFRRSQAWACVQLASAAWLAIDPMNEAPACAVAESLALLGHREEALRSLTAFEAADGKHSSGSIAIRHLRTRIRRLDEGKSESVLRGRANCLAFLEAEWNATGRGAARRSALVGQAGIGKTRVSDAFAARVAMLGAPVLRFHCDRQSEVQPLSLFSQLLPQLREMRGSLGAAPEYAAALAKLRPPSPGTDASAVSTPYFEASRSELQRALIDLLEAVTDDRRLLVIVDDAHFLDDASAQLIATLTRGSNEADVHFLLCVRPSSRNAMLLQAECRGSALSLQPLSAADSAEVVYDIRGRHADRGHVAWCVQQAAGNPFYLRTLASHDRDAALHPTFHIGTLATSLYASLLPGGRALLEACLLLGRLATLQRAQDIAGLDDLAMLGALRELEELDLVHCAQGTLSGPHALLDEALRAVIPTAVAAYLHRRIAAHLEGESAAAAHASPLLWSAAQNWLDAGDPHAAAQLIRRCASYAALVGEPTTATTLLSKVAGAQLPPELHASLLDDLMRYAEHSGSQAVVASASRMRYAVAVSMDADPQRLKAIEFRVIEAELANGGRVPAAVPQLLSLLDDSSLEPALRAQVAARLMVIADLDLDADLAHRVLRARSALPADDAAAMHCMRADLVFHTAFGDVDAASALAHSLVSAVPADAITSETIRVRHFAAYSLFRLRDMRLSSRLLEEAYEAMHRQGLRNQALYSASLRTEIAITEGDFETARIWARRSRAIADGIPSHELMPWAGLYGNEGLIAMHDGDYDSAQRLLFEPASDFAMLSADRFRAVSLALAIRLRQLQGSARPDDPDWEELGQLYAKGRCFGGQDCIVETLWCALVLAGDPNGASDLLSTYLTKYRRERSGADWSLHHTTAADEVWSCLVVMQSTAIEQEGTYPFSTASGA